MNIKKCYICKQKFPINCPPNEWNFSTHKWLCHYLYKTEEIQSKAEEEEIGNTIKLQNITSTNNLKIELMEKTICEIKVDIEDLEIDQLKLEQKMQQE